MQAQGVANLPMSFNDEQKLAVEHPLNQPACLIAGAGSGKTHTLTGRVRWLYDQGVPLKRICVLTFTNKAAEELRARLGVDTESNNARIGTIHSLALSAIRKNPLGFGLQEKVTPLDDYDQIEMFKKIIGREDAEIKPWDIRDKIAYHRARAVGFAVDYTDVVHQAALKAHAGFHALNQEMLEIWKKYEIEKTKNSVVDFDDMVHLTTRRGREDEKWRAAVQRMFDHVLMDEAQDTNPVQWEFVNMLLAPTNMNMYVVGDMSQSIYGFSGAVPELLREYSEGWRNTVPSLYRLARNHRSGQNIVNLANAIQAKMTRTIPLKMLSYRGEQGFAGETKVMVGDTPRDIARMITQEIHRDNALKTRPYKYKDNAILVRSGKSQIRDIEAELVACHIPYIVRGGQSLLKTEEVRDVLSYLRIATNEKDFMALVRSVAVPKRGVGEKSLERIRQIADENYHGDLIAALCQNRTDRLSMYIELVERVKLNKTDPIKALDLIIQLTKYEDYIRDKYKKDKTKVDIKLENLGRLAVMIDAIQMHTPGITTEDIVFQLTMHDSIDPTDEAGKVVVSTIHSAKGLEWPRVYVTNLYEGSLPHRWSMGNEEEIEEERRLLYVAETRARDVVKFCIPDNIQQGPNIQSVRPSRFLEEVGIEP